MAKRSTVFHRTGYNIEVYPTPTPTKTLGVNARDGGYWYQLHLICSNELIVISHLIPTAPAGRKPIHII